MASERVVLARVATLALLFAVPWMVESGCVPKGACLRNTDCPKGQSCVEGACAYPLVVQPGDATSPGPVNGDAGGSSEPPATVPDASSSPPPSSTDSGTSVSHDAADVIVLTDR